MANNESKKLAVDIIARVDKLEKGMARASSTSRKQFTRIESDAKTMATRVNATLGTIGKGISIGAGVVGVGGLLAGLGLNAIVDTVKGAAGELAKIGDTADRIGITAEALQSLQFASEQAGGSVEAVDSGLTKFTANLADASVKGGELFKVLQANNVAFTDATGKLLPTTTMLGRYAELVKNAKTPAEQLELAIRAFGRAAGPELVGLLKEGEGGLKSMMDQAKDAGAVIDNDLIKKAQELDDKFAAISRTVGNSVKGAIVAAVGAMQQLIHAADEYRSRLPGGANAKTIDPQEFGRSQRLGQLNKLLSGPSGKTSAAKAWEEERSELIEIGKQRAMLGRKLTEEAVAETKVAEAAVKPTVLPASGAGGGGEKAAASTRLQGYAALRQAAVSRIADLNAESVAMGLTTSAAEALRLETELLNRANQMGIKLSPEQQSELKSLANEYGGLAAKIEKTAESQELFQSIAKDALGGFISDIRAGTSAAESFTKVLERIGDKLIDIGLNSLFDSKGGNPLGSLFSGIFGGGGSGLKMNPTGRAAGGQVKVGSAYEVGESGRETFVPTQPGRIIPHGRGGGNVQVIVNNNAGAQVSTRQTNGPQGPAIHVQIDEAVANALANGSKTASVLKAWGGSKMR